MKDRKLLNIELKRVSAEEYVGRGFAVVLDNVRSAHNVGSVFRTADSFGADLICLCGITACPPSAEIHKAALGAELSVPFKYFENTEDALDFLRTKGYVVASVEQTLHSVSLENFDADRKVAYVFGNEVDGVQQQIVDASDLSIEIPQFGTKHSLNISVCAGAVLWHHTERAFRR